MKIMPRLLVTSLIIGSSLSASAQGTKPLPKPLPEPLKLNANREDIYKSIVRIEVANQEPNYKTPWNSGRYGGGVGTGFLIGKNRFLTNAHVVSNSKQVIITMHGSAIKHQAKVLHIAHDCDLAILEVNDFGPFEKLQHLSIGKVPKLESQVRVIGYPVGGDRISVTRGVVSRIDFRQYSHSRKDSHLVVQIDAAINPGNSGGPVLQQGNVVGVAFQGLTSADNTGYMIPTPVIKRFLEDIKDGKYDHYVSLGITEFPLFNPAMRKIYNLGRYDSGVLVARVTTDSPSDGILKEGDILTAIDGKDVDPSGSIMVEGERVNMNEVVERKFAGDFVKIDYIRDGKKLSSSIKLFSETSSEIYSILYEKRPRYTIQGGLVFQPLSFNLYSTMRLNNPRVRRLYAKYKSENIFKDRQDIVILTRVLSDRVNEELSPFIGNAIESINGVKVKNFKHAHALLHPKVMPEFFDIRCDGLNRPIILPGKDIDSINQRIQRNYGIKNAFNLNQ